MKTKRRSGSNQKKEEIIIYGTGILIAVLVFVCCLKCSAGRTCTGANGTCSFQERDLFKRLEMKTRVDTNGFNEPSRYTYRNNYDRTMFGFEQRSQLLGRQIVKF